ncbi:hypothetical protein HYDPIDRAFT_120385 [Hydnomerulius pinastri MD-312]|uniref:Unplaced genomic scaffold scaffold_305, whole genome shotgun sequence n=1 Tax=Hydnomerulius pinastri MD-312 TaxID=994086 RepID=A0A0C9W6I0_9AGAM|nr:hypothetical protein HYDPIDRAFT_120385 [Hydnomerulius pinastri MD-312]
MSDPHSLPPSPLDSLPSPFPTKLPTSYKKGDRVLILARRVPFDARRTWHRGIVHGMIPVLACYPINTTPSNETHYRNPRATPHYHYKIHFQRYEPSLVKRIWRYPIRWRYRNVCHWKLRTRVLPDTPESVLQICLSGRQMVG